MDHNLSSRFLNLENTYDYIMSNIDISKLSGDSQIKLGEHQIKLGGQNWPTF